MKEKLLIQKSLYWEDNVCAMVIVSLESILSTIIPYGFSTKIILGTVIL